MVKLRIIVMISLFVIINSITLASALPDYFDWRDKDGQNWMTPVKHQHDCGSCWAFSAVGVVEVQYNIAKNNANYDLNLSEENLVANCSGPIYNHDCAGGWHYDALEYVRDFGIVNETCFPYVDSNCPMSCGCTYGCSNAKCSDNQCTDQDDFYKIDDYEPISSNKEIIKDCLVNNGPVSVAMKWSGGYWDNEIRRCSVDWPVTHAVIITGYNETGDYWIVKNSYGENWWVEGGYFKNGFGECSIESMVYGVNLGTIKTLTISNTGTANLVVTSITDNRDWITSISPTSFSVSPSSSEDVTVTINPSGYSPGFYSGTISIYSNDPDEDPKTVTVTMNISKYSDGHSCSSDSDCQSNHCDNDGVGWTDDGWCFSIESTYYDNQDHKCEESARSANDDWCDEKRNEDLNTCDKTGVTYKEDTCSDTCAISDKTIFECTESGCSCTEPLCDGLTTGSNINTCASGQTYFADKCTSTAGGEDRGDNICRNSTFASGCTADAECNGVEVGTGGCSASCNYIAPDTHKFSHKNSSGSIVAWFGNLGNIVLKGNCYSGGSCDNPRANSFIIRNSTNANVAFINSTGDLCIVTGDCSDQSATCNPTRDAFIMRNSSNYNMSYIDFDGDLCLTGKLYENSEL